jgi:hypothetical protein
MILDLRLSEKQKAEIQSRFEEYVETMLTDEMLEKAFADCLRGCVKTQIGNFLNSPDFRDIIRDRIIPIIIEQFAPELMLKELEK